MAARVARSRHCGDREVGSADEESGGQNAHGTVGIEEKEGGSGSRSVSSTGHYTDNNSTGKVYNSSVGGNCEDTRSPNIAFAWKEAEEEEGCVDP